jgi:opacity protein-like surface antigen
MPKLWMLAVALGLAFAPSGVLGAPRIEKGSQELSLHVSPDFEGAIGDTIFAEAGYGVFVRDRIEIKGVLAYHLLEDVAGADSDYRMKGFDLAAEYHLDFGSAFVPYLGAGIGWVSSEFGKTKESGLVYGPRAGLKYFLADNVALGLDVVYRLGSADVFVNDFQAEDTDLTYVIGVRVLF